MVIMNKVCVKCKKKPIHNKKRGLCLNCYQHFQRSHGPILKGNPENYKSKTTISRKKYSSEIEFVRNYFDHSEWIYQPCMFRLGDEKYSPDFYDKKRNVFIEVSGTKQAYHQAKEKYILFRETFPEIKLEIRKSYGTILDEKTRNKEWKIIKLTK